jgi:hypothetical protein
MVVTGTTYAVIATFLSAIAVDGAQVIFVIFRNVDPQKPGQKGVNLEQ